MSPNPKVICWSLGQSLNSFSPRYTTPIYIIFSFQQSKKVKKESM